MTGIVSIPEYDCYNVSIEVCDCQCMTGIVSIVACDCYNVTDNVWLALSDCHYQCMGVSVWLSAVPMSAAIRKVPALLAAFIWMLVSI